MNNSCQAKTLFLYYLQCNIACIHMRELRLCVCRLLINLSLLNGCIIGLDGWHTQTGEWRRSLIGPPMHTHFVHDIFAHTCAQLYDFCRARTNFVVVVHTSDSIGASPPPIQNSSSFLFFVFVFIYLCSTHIVVVIEVRKKDCEQVADGRAKRIYTTDTQRWRRKKILSSNSLRGDKRVY